MQKFLSVISSTMSQSLQLSTLNLNIKRMPIGINLDQRFKFRDIAKMLLDITAISYRYRIKRCYQKQLLLLQETEKGTVDNKN
jgi:hypothetical protein